MKQFTMFAVAMLAGVLGSGCGLGGLVQINTTGGHRDIPLASFGGTVLPGVLYGDSSYYNRVGTVKVGITDDCQTGVWFGLTEFSGDSYRSQESEWHRKRANVSRVRGDTYGVLEREYRAEIDSAWAAVVRQQGVTAYRTFYNTDYGVDTRQFLVATFASETDSRPLGTVKVEVSVQYRNDQTYALTLSELGLCRGSGIVRTYQLQPTYRY